MAPSYRKVWDVKALLPGRTGSAPRKVTGHAHAWLPAPSCLMRKDSFCPGIASLTVRLVTSPVRVYMNLPPQLASKATAPDTPENVRYPSLGTATAVKSSAQAP